MTERSLTRTYQKLFELTHDAVFLCVDWKILSCNIRVSEMLGLSPGELRDSPVEQIPISPTEREGFFSRLKALKGEDKFECDTSCVHKSGALVPCRVSAVGLVNEEGLLCLVTMKDLSENREIERELHKRTAQLQATLNSLPFDFWINDSENRTVMQNDHSRNLWGEQLGHHMEEVTDREEIKKKWRKTNKRALRGEVVEGEQVYDIQGKKKTFRNIVAPIIEDGKVTGILGLNIDITGYKTTQRRLSLALEERETLLREVHHRVKNNLQLIISLLNLQKANLGESELKTVREIEGRINTMAIIHEQLYNSDSLNRISIPNYLKNLAQSVRGMYGTTHRNIKLEVSSDELTLPIEKALPVGIMINELLTNSIKHAFSGKKSGHIYLHLATESGENPVTRLTVRDDGVGCSRENQGFTSGLGLTLVRQLAIQVGGELSIDTEAGKGFSTSMIFPGSHPHPTKTKAGKSHPGKTGDPDDPSNQGKTGTMA